MNWTLSEGLFKRLDRPRKENKRLKRLEPTFYNQLSILLNLEAPRLNYLTVVNPQNYNQ